jgi:hypothetical protein
MPSITIEATADQIDSEDELWALLKQLKAAGYVGSITAATFDTDPNGDVGWSLQATLPPAPMNRLEKPVEARIGDWKVVINGAISVLTQDEYTATYGTEVEG